MKKLILVGIMFVNMVMYGYSVDNLSRDLDTLFKIVSETQELSVEGVTYELNVRQLMEMTLQVESRFGQDKYTGRIAKTAFQYEPDTVEHYVKIMPELKKYLEDELGRKLKLYDNKDSVFVAYIVYMSKIQYHKNWLDKYSRVYFRKSGDVEWLVYKTLWNSPKGSTTHKTWTKRLDELNKLKIDISYKKWYTIFIKKTRGGANGK